MTISKGSAGGARATRRGKVRQGNEKRSAESNRFGFRGAAGPAALGLAFALAGCSEEDAGPRNGQSGPGGNGVEVALGDQVIRERVAALFAEDRLGEARDALRPLVERAKPAGEDVLRAATIELAASEIERARPLAQAALAALPESASAHWNWSRVLVADGETEAARPYLERALELAPDNYPAGLALGGLYQDLDLVDEAEAQYKRLLEVPVEFSGSWRLPTLFRYWRLLVFEGRPEAQSDAILAEHTRLKGTLEAPSAQQISRGTLGLLEPPPPLAPVFPEPAALTPLEPLASASGGVDLPGDWLGVFAGVLKRYVLADEDEEEQARRAPYLYAMPFVAPAFVTWGADGVAVWSAGASGFEAVTVTPAAATCATGFDLGAGADGDGDLDLVVASGGVVRLFENDGDGWSPWPEVLFDAGAGASVRDVVAVDVDHDGDVDFMLAGSFGIRVLRSDGAGAEGGGYTELGAEAGLPMGGDYAWCLAEDFDADQDVDLLFGGASGAFLASNERGGRFSDASSGLPAGLRDAAPATRPLVADLNADLLPDLALAADPPLVWLGAPEGGFRAAGAAGGREASGWPGGSAAAVVADWDLDGALDLVFAGAGALAQVQLAPGFYAQQQELAAGEVPAARGMAVVDFDGDARPDLARVGADGVALYRGAGTKRGLALSLRGIKDNDRGIGAVVEVRSGAGYTRRYARGEPLLVGLGSGAAGADVVRVTWPNGVIQNFVDVAATQPWRMDQKKGLIGSCPFLYAWNGETYTFISDVIGITPLGLPMGPGQLVPPDHDEYVLVRGDQLRPKDGFYELQFTEELREVTYLDRIRLDVVDHPAGTEVYPNERFSFPPFPEARTHVTRAPLAPTRVVDQAGVDWTAAIAAEDSVLATPFEPLDGQYLGLATPHALEFQFDAAEVKDAEQLRLFFTGWFLWTDASVNMAAARHPSIAFVPPILQVPDAEGGWRDAGPPLGFPAGKLKTMVIDVTDIIDRKDPRVRLFSTLQLYWDAVRLGIDVDEPAVTRPLEPASAELWERGFSAVVPFEDYPELDWFDWNAVSDQPRWNQHPGAYTRFGGVLPLLTEVDDMFVIMGAGDTLTVRFDARELPELKAGWERDFLVFLDGWAKDRDPNTHDALRVEPLPFHGMSGYPYGPDEAYPRDEAHRRYRYEWNTRPGRSWMPRLALPTGTR